MSSLTLQYTIGVNVIPILFSRRALQDPEFHLIEGMTDYLMRWAIERGCTRIMEILIEKGFQVKDTSLLRLAIVEKQLSSLLLLLHNKNEIEIVDLKSLYPFTGLFSDKEALITLPTLLEFCGSLESDAIIEFINELLHHNCSRCMKVFFKYLSKNKNKSEIQKILLSEPKYSNSNLLEFAGRRCEENFMFLIDFFDIEDINFSHHQIYHILLEEKKYKCMKKLFDKAVILGKENNPNFITINVGFLNSVEKMRNHGNSREQDDSILPSLLHKLNNCEDSKVKFHPVVSEMVKKKLVKYRLWYILTFVLYCIFLPSLYFALFNASYQCVMMRCSVILVALELYVLSVK